MATTAKANNKNLIIGIGAIVTILIVLVIAIVLAARNSGISDSFFKSDNTKYVFTLEPEELSAIGEEDLTPEKAHMVYFYEGEKITDLKSYYLFSDENEATKAYSYFQENGADGYKSIARDGKYVILTANPSEYENITTSNIKEQIEFFESLKDLDLEAFEEEDDELIEVDDDESSEEDEEADLSDETE